MCGSFFVNYRMQAGNLAMFLTRNSSICRHIAVLKPRIVRKIFAQAPCSVHTKTMSNGYTLVSFDVDGTLIHSIGQRANKLHKVKRLTLQVQCDIFKSSRCAHDASFHASRQPLPFLECRTLLPMHSRQSSTWTPTLMLLSTMAGEIMPSNAVVGLTGTGGRFTLELLLTL